MRYEIASTKLICEKGDKKVEYTSANRILTKQGTGDEYIVIIKAEVENSEFNDFIQENEDFDLTIQQVVKNIVNNKTEIIIKNISNISFCKKITTFDSDFLYQNIITIVLTTVMYDYEDIKFMLENDKKEEYVKSIINVINENGQFIGETLKSIKKNIELSVNDVKSKSIEDFTKGLETYINSNIGKLKE